MTAALAPAALDAADRQPRRRAHEEVRQDARPRRLSPERTAEVVHR